MITISYTTRTATFPGTFRQPLKPRLEIERGELPIAETTRCDWFVNEVSIRERWKYGESSYLDRYQEEIDITAETASSLTEAAYPKVTFISPRDDLDQ